MSDILPGFSTTRCQTSIMRLWSIHPKYLDSKGLVALWREGLLAYAVLRGRTRGYKHHPQLERFLNFQNPTKAVRAYLHTVCDEADRRGYRFDRSKLGHRTRVPQSRITTGQLRFELQHLKKKLGKRDRHQYRRIRSVRRPEPHPSFRAVSGRIAPWEKVGSTSSMRKAV